MMVVCTKKYFQQRCRHRHVSLSRSSRVVKKNLHTCLSGFFKFSHSQGSIFLLQTLTAIAILGQCCRKILFMQLPKIKCYTAAFENKLPSHFFFILSRGNNSGKPLDNPCPNCFIAICDDENQREQFYWLSYALWQGKHYFPYLKGSCVQLIRIDDVNVLFKRGITAAQERNETYCKAVVKMRNFQRFKTDAELLLKKQLQVHRAMLHTILFTQNLSFQNH
jgi:hypothetical protein